MKKLTHMSYQEARKVIEDFLKLRILQGRRGQFIKISFPQFCRTVLRRKGTTTESSVFWSILEEIFKERGIEYVKDMDCDHRYYVLIKNPLLEGRDDVF